MSGRGRTGAVVALAAGVTLLVAAFALVAVDGGDGGRGGGGGGGGSDDAITEPEPGAAAASPAVERFLADYVDADGRVVRHDQGGDTVSEGQAYALLLALAAGDEQRFTTVWSWTRDNLQRADGLFAWHWQDGQVADDSPATDADLDIARALAIGADRFDRPELADAARRTADAVIDHETITVAGRRVLAAGPWAVDRRVVNPSYLARCDADDLAELTGDDRWRQVGSDGRELLGSLIDAGLPPDWAVLDGDGVAQPVAGPDASDEAGSGRYGLDAARIPVRLAACTSDRESDLAAALWPRLHDLDDHGAGTAYGLDGTPDDRATHPLGLVGGAAAAAAAGDRNEAGALLAEAEDMEAQRSTYYGAAWVAFGQLLLDPHGAGDVAAPEWQAVSAERPQHPQQEQPTTTGAPSSTTAPTTAPSTTGTTAGPTTTATGSPTTTTASSATPTTEPGGTTATTDTTGDPSTTSTPTGGSPTPSRRDAGDLSTTGDEQPLPFADDDATATATGEGTRRKTGALALGGFGTALVLGAILGLRERTLTRRPHPT